MNPDSILAAEAIDLSGGWSKLWSAVQGALGSGLVGLLTAIGVIIVVFAVAKWFWDRKRNGGGDSKGLFWALAVGMLFAAPEIVLPVALTIADAVANALVNIWNSA